MEEEINDYGNRVAKITLDFIKGEYSESVRDSMYKDAGYYLLEKLNTTINLAVSKERERIVEAINQLRLKDDAWKHTFPQEYNEGYRIALDDIETNPINTK